MPFFSSPNLLNASRSIYVSPAKSSPVTSIGFLAIISEIGRLQIGTVASSCLMNVKISVYYSPLVTGGLMSVQ